MFRLTAILVLLFINCFSDVNFTIPTTTPTGISPNLSEAGEGALRPQITTDSTGKYVYAVWNRSDGSNQIIQVAISSDYGNTWTDHRNISKFI